MRALWNDTILILFDTDIKEKFLLIHEKIYTATGLLVYQQHLKNTEAALIARSTISSITYHRKSELSRWDSQETGNCKLQNGLISLFISPVLYPSRSKFTKGHNNTVQWQKTSTKYCWPKPLILMSPQVDFFLEQNLKKVVL